MDASLNARKQAFVRANQGPGQAYLLLLLPPRYLGGFFSLVIFLVLGGCASSEPSVPYPAFIQTAELPDIFMAGMPGIRAKRLAGDPETRRSSNLVSLPADWSFTTGGLPDKSIELYVLRGEVQLGDLKLQPGGYAWLPSGTTGVPLATTDGAQLLYFLDDANPDSVIQTPLVLNEELVPWQYTRDLAGFGIAEKVLRDDPGSGARTWLRRVEPGATLPWQRSSVREEGMLLSGDYWHSECVEGIPVTRQYLPGGYYYRPSGAVNGGPESRATTPSVWYLRTIAPGAVSPSTCGGAEAASP